MKIKIWAKYAEEEIDVKEEGSSVRSQIGC